MIDHGDGQHRRVAKQVVDGCGIAIHQDGRRVRRYGQPIDQCQRNLQQADHLAILGPYDPAAGDQPRWFPQLGFHHPLHRPAGSDGIGIGVVVGDHQYQIKL